jgi:tRNA nucleotidyltransferase (CCA-adding enzyme)
MNIPSQVVFILQQLNKHNFEAFLVGGCVRDYIMDKAPQDFDITTSALPIEIKKIFKNTVDTGIKHGTITVLIDNMPFEVTTYRVDGDYEDNRRPTKVTYTTSLEEDLRRRDFTINAIAYHPKEGFVDPFLGKDDIQNKIIRGVGNPSKRFEEDALRMLRALRFKAQLNFAIEEYTYIALQKNVHLIQHISIERCREEICKIIMSDNPSIKDIYETNMLSYINNCFYCYIKDNFNFIINTSQKDIILRLSIIFWFMDSDTLCGLLKNMKFDNKTIKIVCTIVSYNKITLTKDFYDIRKSLSLVGATAFKYILEVKKIYGLDANDILINYNKILKDNDCFAIKNLLINGEDLKAIGIHKGIQIGETLKFLLDEVLKDQSLNKKDTLITLAKNKI